MYGFCSCISSQSINPFVTPKSTNRLIALLEDILEINHSSKMMSVAEYGRIGLNDCVVAHSHKVAFVAFIYLFNDYNSSST